MRYLASAAVMLAFLAGTAAPAAAVDVLSRKVKSASLDPSDRGWQTVKAVRIPLLAQQFVPPFGGGATKFVEVKSLYTQGDVYFLLSWEDKTQSIKSGLSGKFLDGCALQLPIKQGTPPSFMMGQKGGPVNIWLWKSVVADEQRLDKVYVDFYRSGSIDHRVHMFKPAQNLIAEGFSTLTLLPVQEVAGVGTWKDGRWTVVFKRRIQTQNGTSLRPDTTLPIAFAVWDGGGTERNGFKSLSLWHNLVLGGGKVAVTGKK